MYDSCLICEVYDNDGNIVDIVYGKTHSEQFVDHSLGVCNVSCPICATELEEAAVASMIDTIGEIL